MTEPMRYAELAGVGARVDADPRAVRCCACFFGIFGLSFYGAGDSGSTRRFFVEMSRPRKRRF